MLYHELILYYIILYIPHNCGDADVFVIMTKISGLDNELQHIVSSLDETLQSPTSKITVSLPLQFAAEIFLLLPFDAAMDFILCIFAGVDQ